MLAGPVSDKGSFPAVQTDVFLLLLRQRAENGILLSSPLSPRDSRYTKGQSDGESPGMSCDKTIKGDLRDVSMSSEKSNS